MFSFGGRMAEREEAEYEKVALEVDAEMLYLNTVGLRRLGEWLGIRGARLHGKGRVEVLRDVRSYLARSSDAEDTLQGKTLFLTGMRDQIRELMQEPDNWEQTPSNNRAMLPSGESTSTARGEVSRGYVPPCQPREVPQSDRPIPARRTGLFQRAPPAIDQSEPLEVSVVDGQGLQGVPENSVGGREALVSGSGSEFLLADRSVRRRQLPSLPVQSISLNRVPHWNRQGQLPPGGASLDESIRRRVEEDRRRQMERNSLNLGSDTNTLAQLDRLSARRQVDEDSRRQMERHTVSLGSETFTVLELQESGEEGAMNLSEEEDNQRIQMLQ